MRPSQKGLPTFLVTAISWSHTNATGPFSVTYSTSGDSQNFNRNCHVQGGQWNYISPSRPCWVSERGLRRMTKCPVTTEYNPEKTKGHTVSLSLTLQNYAGPAKLCSSCKIPTVFVWLKCLCCDSLHCRHPVIKEELVLVVFVKTERRDVKVTDSYCLFRKWCAVWQKPK